MMRKFFEHRLWTILAAFLAVVMLILLAAGLGKMQFLPGHNLARLEEVSSFQVSIDNVAEQIAAIPIWKQVVFWALIFFLVIIVASLFPPEWRKKIIKYFLRYALFILGLYIILKNFRYLIPGLNFGNAGANTSNTTGIEAVSPPVFAPPHIPPVLIYLISLGVIVVLAGSSLLIVRWWMKRGQSTEIALPLQDLAEISRASLAELSAGKDWEDAVIRCYARMVAVVNSRRGLQRRKDLTPSEFAARLEAAGLPHEPVRRLTRLFEAARYGGKTVKGRETREAKEAAACLTGILNACGVEE